MVRVVCTSVEGTKKVAAIIGGLVKGGEVIAFTSDVGGGKTTFVKGLAKGMGIDAVVQSPTFTISFIHKAARGLELHHFDFYRLNEAGVMRAELAESLEQPNAVVAIEWGEIVGDVLPTDAIKVAISVQDNEARVLSFEIPQRHVALLDALNQYNQQKGTA